jgi:topoisomerase-4 subunit A
MKLSRLSKLDLTELNDDEEKYRDQVAALARVIGDESERYAIIEKDLDEIKKILGKDERLTEIIHARPTAGLEDIEAPLVKKEWLIYSDGVVCADEIVAMSGKKGVASNLVDVALAYGREDLVAFNAAAELVPANKITKDQIPLLGAFSLADKGSKLVSVTANGNIKVSMRDDYKFTKIEKALKLKDDDKLVFAALCDDNDYLILFDGEQHILKLSVAELPVASKMTVGVKSGFKSISAATVANDSDLLLFCTTDNKGKFTSVKDFSVDSRGNKGQLVAEGTCFSAHTPASSFRIHPFRLKTRR